MFLFICTFPYLWFLRCFTSEAEEMYLYSVLISFYRVFTIILLINTYYKYKNNNIIVNNIYITSHLTSPVFFTCKKKEKK